MSEVFIERGALEAFCARILERAGCSEADASIVARSLVRTDARGVFTHGVFRLPLYLAKIRAGSIDPRAVPEVATHDGAVAVVDGRDGLGAVVGRFAMTHALDLAQRHGVGAVTVRRSNHFGAAAEFVLPAPDRGCIGIATTNAPGTMPPWQGISPLLGNNPFAFAVPTDDVQPFCLDMAVSQVANGKLRVAAQEGKPIPDGWAFDQDGRPTNDARAALEGFLAPSGTYKGYGLSLAFEILAGILSGAQLSQRMPRLVDASQKADIGHFFMALDIGRFLPLSAFKARVSEMLAEVRAGRLAPGYERVVVAGDIENEMERESQLRGVPLAGSTWEALMHEAAAVGVTVPHLLKAR